MPDEKNSLHIVMDAATLQRRMDRSFYTVVVIALLEAIVIVVLVSALVRR